MKALEGTVLGIVTGLTVMPVSGPGFREGRARPLPGAAKGEWQSTPARSTATPLGTSAHQLKWRSKGAKSEERKGGGREREEPTDSPPTDSWVQLGMHLRPPAPCRASAPGRANPTPALPLERSSFPALWVPVWIEQFEAGGPESTMQALTSSAQQRAGGRSQRLATLPGRGIAIMGPDLPVSRF